MFSAPLAPPKSVHTFSILSIHLTTLKQIIRTPSVPLFGEYQCLSIYLSIYLCMYLRHAALSLSLYLSISISLSLSSSACGMPLSLSLSLSLYLHLSLCLALPAACRSLSLSLFVTAVRSPVCENVPMPLHMHIVGEMSCYACGMPLSLFCLHSAFSAIIFRIHC